MNRRKKKLVKSALQMKLVSAFLAMAVVASLFQVVLLNVSLLKLTEDLGVQTADVMARFSTVLLRNLLITLGVLIPFMAVFGILLTHRVAGPVYKFERYLEDVVRGDEVGECRIRRGDELHGLCERINMAVYSLKARAAESAKAQSTDPSEDRREAA